MSHKQHAANGCYRFSVTIPFSDELFCVSGNMPSAMSEGERPSVMTLTYSCESTERLFNLIQAVAQKYPFAKEGVIEPGMGQVAGIAIKMNTEKGAFEKTLSELDVRVQEPQS